MTIDTNKNEIQCNVQLNTMLTGTFGGSSGELRYIQRKKKEPMKLFQRIFKDSLLISSLRSYPNPVSAGGLMKLELNKAEAGKYQADLINQNGQIIHSTTVIFEN